MERIFTFPNPVNETSARIVATGVVIMGCAVLLGANWVLVPLTYGFLARVLTGPTLSPLGQLATKVITPRLGMAPQWTAGPPKRFAQAMGAALTVTAALLHYAAGLTGAAHTLVLMLVLAAALEAFAGYCLGCKIFGLLMKAGLIPEEICIECSNIQVRVAQRA